MQLVHWPARASQYVTPSKHVLLMVTFGVGVVTSVRFDKNFEDTVLLTLLLTIESFTNKIVGRINGSGSVGGGGTICELINWPISVSSIGIIGLRDGNTLLFV